MSNESNFIEIWHESEEGDKENWFATRSITFFPQDHPSALPFGLEAWDINGKLTVFGLDDVKALRSLLDAIEERLKEDAK